MSALRTCWCKVKRALSDDVVKAVYQLVRPAGIPPDHLHIELIFVRPGGLAKGCRHRVASAWLAQIRTIEIPNSQLNRLHYLSDNMNLTVSFSIVTHGEKPDFTV